MDAVNDTVPRIDAHAMSPEEFIQKYEKNYIPVVITNSQSHWQAQEKWTLHVCIQLFLLCQDDQKYIGLIIQLVIDILKII